MNNKIIIILSFLLLQTVSAADHENEETFECVNIVETQSVAASSWFVPADHNPMAEARAQTNMLLEKGSHLLAILGCEEIIARHSVWLDKPTSTPTSHKECTKFKTTANPHEANTYTLRNICAFRIEGGFILYCKKGNIVNQIVCKNYYEGTDSELKQASSIMINLARLLIEEEQILNDNRADAVRMDRIPQIQDEMRKRLTLPKLTMKHTATFLMSDYIRKGYKAFEIMFNIENTESDVFEQVDKTAKGMLRYNPLLEIHFIDPETYIVRLSNEAVLKIHDPERRFISESTFRTFNSEAFLKCELPWDGSKGFKVDVWYKVGELVFEFVKFPDLNLYYKSVFRDSCGALIVGTKAHIYPRVFTEEAFPSFPQVIEFTEEHCFVDAATQTTDEVETANLTQI